jgi:hypothetical protein
MKAERRTALIKSIARGRAWLDEIVSGTASIEGIAAPEVQRSSGQHDYIDGIHRAGSGQFLQQAVKIVVFLRCIGRDRSVKLPSQPTTYSASRISSPP